MYNTTLSVICVSRVHILLASAVMKTLCGPWFIQRDVGMVKSAVVWQEIVLVFHVDLAMQYLYEEVYGAECLPKAKNLRCLIIAQCT